MNNSKSGKIGIEKSFDEELRGKLGNKSVEINDKGSGIVAVLPYEIAEQKGVEVLISARTQGFPMEIKLETS